MRKLSLSRSVFRKVLICLVLGLLSFLLALAFGQVYSPIHTSIAKADVAFPYSNDHINVKDFGAKGDGVTDDTAAIQKAISATTRDFQVVYIPSGTYLVKDTIELGRRRVIQGANEKTTIIRLQDATPEFGGNPKPVLHSLYNNNQTFAIYIRDLTLDTGKDNPGAIGIQYNTHNTGTIENVTIRSEDHSGAIGLDMSETEFGPGMIANLTVIGFDVGIKTPGNTSHAVFHNIILKEQNVVGFENNMPVSIQGLTSTNKVPAIQTSSHPLAHLVLIDANLIALSGIPSGVAGIEADGHYYLRDVRTQGGYAAVLKDRGKLVSGNTIAEKWSDIFTELPSDKQGHLKLAISNPPAPYLEPVENWIIPDASPEDDTASVQAAMNSGAQTIFFPANFPYLISDTIEVPSTVKRIVATGDLTAAKPRDRFVNKPMLRFVGKTSKPITVEWMRVSAWPKELVAFEVSTDRPVYFKYCGSATRATITTSQNWSGEVYVDEWLGAFRLNGTGSVWVRQWNPENNPFTPGKSDPEVTYAINDGAKLWVLGTKTEAPALHVITQNGGKTELLGGFFRDHLGPDEYEPAVPYFLTRKASLSASYLQYAWTAGKARSLQALEIQGDSKNDLVTPPGTFIMDLYRSGQY